MRPEAELREAVREVLAVNDLIETTGRVRITVTGGESPLGSERGESPTSVIVAASAMGEWPETAAVVTVPWTRNESRVWAWGSTPVYRPTRSSTP